jgi:restriction system protein
MILRVLAIGLAVLIAIPFIIAFPPLALLGLGGMYLLFGRGGAAAPKRGRAARTRSRSPRKARPASRSRRPRLGRALLWIAGILGLVAGGSVLAQEAPWLLAVLVVLGLALLLWRRSRRPRRGSIVGFTAPGKQAGAARQATVPSGTAFEWQVVELLKGLNYRHVQHVGGAGDRGIDIIAKDTRGRTFLVQCKRFTSGAKVGSVDIQKLIGAVVHHGADGGIFVTTSSYTPAAAQLARGGRVAIDLFDGNDVARLSRRLSA